MICTYCRSQNGPEDHRCGRCGRRLTDDAPRRSFPVQHTAAAPAIDSLDETSEAPAPAPVAPGPRLVVAPRPAPQASASPSATVGVQAPLFPLNEVPRTMTSKPAAKQAPMSPAPSMRRKAARAAQPSLFDTTHDGSRTLPTSVEAAVCCDAEVAAAGDRMFAAAIDMLVPTLGFMLFCAGFYAIAGSVTPEAKMLPWVGAAFLSLVLLYRITWCVAGFDTPGMQAAGLRLISLDGRRPTKWARVCRTVGGLVSALSLGIGLLWGLLDEERLTWHDHMSATFPTQR